jgi:hypothetical protein
LHEPLAAASVPVKDSICEFRVQFIRRDGVAQDAVQFSPTLDNLEVLKILFICEGLREKVSISSTSSSSTRPSLIRTSEKRGVAKKGRKSVTFLTDKVAESPASSATTTTTINPSGDFTALNILAEQSGGPVVIKAKRRAPLHPGKYGRPPAIATDQRREILQYIHEVMTRGGVVTAQDVKDKFKLETSARTIRRTLSVLKKDLLGSSPSEEEEDEKMDPSSTPLPVEPINMEQVSPVDATTAMPLDEVPLPDPPQQSLGA